MTTIAPILNTMEETAAILNIGRDKAYRLVASGELRSVKIGGSRRVTNEAIEDFVNRLVAAAAEQAS